MDKKNQNQRQNQNENAGKKSDRNQKKESLERKRQRLRNAQNGDYGRVLRTARQFKNDQPDSRNIENRLPAIILVDASMSMYDYRAALRKAARRLYEEIKKEQQAANSVELGIYSFNDQIEVIQEIEEVCKQEIDWNSIYFNFAEPTMTGQAVRIAVNHLMGRRAHDRAMGLSTYTPILFILSDGNPQFPTNPELDMQTREETMNVIEDIKKYVKNNQLTVICLQIGKDNQLSFWMQRLTGLAQNDPRLLQRLFKIDKDPAQIEEFFKWASSFLKSSSRGQEMGV